MRPWSGEVPGSALIAARFRLDRYIWSAWFRAVSAEVKPLL